MVTKSTSSPIGSVSHGHSFLIVLLIISLILNALSLYLLMGFSVPVSSSEDNSSVGIKRALLDLEYEKVGGKENYDVLQKYSQMQITQSISQIKGAIENGGTPTPPEQPSVTSADTQKDLSQPEITKLFTDSYIEGAKDATIAVIEYSEMECPFCAQQYHDTQVRKQVLEKYGSQVQFIYKNNRGVNHPGTETKALGLLCAGKLGGESAYTKFLTYVMDNTTLRPQKRDGSVIAVADLSKAATAAGVDVAKWQSCLDKKETQERFAAETAEANRFGLGGTPGTLILNVKTGKYVTIEGAYPYEKFTANIDALLQ